MSAEGTRVTIRDRGKRDPQEIQISEFDGATGTVTGVWNGLIVVSVDDGPEVYCRLSEIEETEKAQADEARVYELARKLAEEMVAAQKAAERDPESEEAKDEAAARTQVKAKG